jgi:predicted nuclease with RNAse H fold
MNGKERVWIGVDPGGRRNFGVAILDASGSARSWCVDHADAAIEIFNGETDSSPCGVGVDAPLWWSSGKSSDRAADKWLRHQYGLGGGQVQTANSLRGAAVVQAVMFVQRIRERFPQVSVTETHPKALWVALRLGTWDEFCRRFSIHAPIRSHQEHQRDAVLGAVAAREGFEGRWSHDLASNRLESEQDPAEYWLAPIHYFWPD